MRGRLASSLDGIDSDHYCGNGDDGDDIANCDINPDVDYDGEHVILIMMVVVQAPSPPPTGTGRSRHRHHQVQ